MFSLRRHIHTSVVRLHENPLGLPKRSANPPPTMPRRGGIVKRAIPNVGKVVLVASGKGGVGKSTVATNLAFAMAMTDSSKRVGLLDLDIFGPSVPTLIGTQKSEEPALTPQGGLIPISNHGLPTMSMGYLLPRTTADNDNTDTPVVWRGLMVQKAVQQLLFDTDWTYSSAHSQSGKGLDALVIDMPPGTGDVPLTVGQLVNVDASVVVSTPQDVALSDVRKSLATFGKLSIPITGLLLNSSHYTCPSCSTPHDIFGSPDSFLAVAERLKLPVLGRLPLVQGVSGSGDEGVPYVLGGKDQDGIGGQEWREVIKGVAKQIFGLVCCCQDSPWPLSSTSTVVRAVNLPIFTPTLALPRSFIRYSRAQQYVSSVKPLVPTGSKPRLGPNYLGIREYFANVASRSNVPSCGHRHNPARTSSRAAVTRSYATSRVQKAEDALPENDSEPLEDGQEERTFYEQEEPSPEEDSSPGKQKTKTKYTRRIHPPHIPLTPDRAFYTAVNAYTERFVALVNAEQAEAESIVNERLSTWSIKRLQAEGYCLMGVTAYWPKYKHYGRFVAVFSVGPGVSLPDLRFDDGCQLLVSREDPLKETPYIGNVISKTDTQIRVAFVSKFDTAGTWRLDLGHSNIVFFRMRAAIAALEHDPSYFEPSTDEQYIQMGTHLRDVLLRSFCPPPECKEESDPHGAHTLQEPADVTYPAEVLSHPSRESGEHSGAFSYNPVIKSWASRHSQPNPVWQEGDPPLEGLNASQRRAAAMMIGERVCLVQGPPGTGKTKTIIETVKVLKSHFRVPEPLLVCTYTNVAVDNLVEGFARVGLSPLRVGGYLDKKTTAPLKIHSLEYKMEQHRLYPSLTKLEESIKQLESSTHQLEFSTSEAKTKKTAQGRVEDMVADLNKRNNRLYVLRRRHYAMEQSMQRDIFNAADVICTTCITAANHATNVIDFPIVFLDEASMSTEPASLIPLMKGSKHVALIGDHKQLPPVIVSKEAQELGLGISLFERLTEEGVVPSIMLDTQYRMHPAISYFPSLEFYNFALLNGTIDESGAVPAHLLPPTTSHHLRLPDLVDGPQPSVTFLDHSGSETQKDRSRVNYTEAHIVCSIIEDLLLNNENLTGADIGIIAPYAAQISLLTRWLNIDSNSKSKLKARFESVLGSQRAMQLSRIEIKTVDGFEGREKDVIIFSTVRNNPTGQIGFLDDRRRLNVGLTRAKRGLFVVGSIDTLKKGKGRPSSLPKEGKTGGGAESWRRYVAYLLESGLVHQLNGSTLDAALYTNLRKAKSVL